MADHLWEKAKKDLTLCMNGGTPDHLVWEHSARVSRMVDLVTRCPEVSNRVVNREALYVAGLYHDYGWVLQVEKGELRPLEVFLRPTTDIQCEMAADWIEARLKGHRDAGVVKTAAQAVRQMKERSSEFLEAQILAEADNLDLIGPQAFCLMIRRQLMEGKSIDGVLASWRSQEEYGYWEARVKECFQYPSVRRVAESRLQALKGFMKKLRETLDLEDLMRASTGNSDMPTDFNRAIFGQPNQDTSN